jgi:hypothetical protein
MEEKIIKSYIEFLQSQNVDIANIKKNDVMSLLLDDKVIILLN